MDAGVRLLAVAQREAYVEHFLHIGVSLETCRQRCTMLKVDGSRRLAIGLPRALTRPARPKPFLVERVENYSHLGHPASRLHELDGSAQRSMGRVASAQRGLESHARR